MSGSESIVDIQPSTSSQGKFSGLECQSGREVYALGPHEVQKGCYVLYCSQLLQVDLFYVSNSKCALYPECFAKFGIVVLN